MILDADLLFSETQSIAAAAGTLVSTNSVDNGPAQAAPGGYGNLSKDMLRAGFLNVLIQILNAVTSGGAATVTFQLVQADDTALATNVDVLAQTRAFTPAELAAGTRIGMQAPAGGFTRRHLGVRYIIATAATTGGTVTAGLVKDLDTSYAVGVIR